MTKKLLASFVLTIIFAMQVYAQGRTVSGKVADKKGEAIPGASIAVKGNSAIATVSKDDGTYSLDNVPEKSMLTFSAMGYNDAEIAIGTESVVNFTLVAVDDLNEVVVIGAVGIQREKKELGYGVTTVGSELLNQGKSTSAALGLSGKVAGLQINQINSGVDGGSRIVLRGNRSILGDNQALIVIDGSQSSQTAFDQLNPNDIESMTVLKGATAAALYGSAASNGVLLVTTKKGQSGALRVTFESTFQVERVSYLPKLQDRFGTGTGPLGTEYMGGENQSFGPAYDGTIRPLGGIDGTPQQIREDGTVDSVRYSPVKNQKLSVWNTGTLLQNNASVSGGTENTRFFMSVQDVLQKGVVDKDQRRRTGVRFNAEASAGKLKAGFTSSYTVDQVQKTTSDFYATVLNTGAHIPLNSYRNWESLTNPDGTLNPANPNYYYNQYTQNPWFDLDNNRSSTRRNTLIANVDVSYELTPWMKAVYRPGVTYTNSATLAYTDKFTYRDFRLTASPTGQLYQATNINGNVNEGSVTSTRITQEAQLLFSPKFSKIFKTSAILGANVNDLDSQNLFAGTTSIVVPGLRTINNRFGEIITANTAANPNFLNRRLRQRSVGLFASVSLGYKDFLFVEVAGRNDWTSLLDKANNSFFYPSANLSFVVSNAIPALKDSKSLSFAKLTFGASKVGNVNIQPYNTKSIYTVGGGFPYGSLTAYTVGDRLVAPGLKPEFTTQYELGMELGFFDRINLEVSAYKSTTTNQTLPVSTSFSSGYNEFLTNIGATSSDGLEITLRGDILKTKGGLVWGANINYTYIDNRVTELYADVKSVSVRGAGDPAFSNNNGSIVAALGEQYPSIQVSAYARDPQGRVIVDAVTGLPSQASAQISGGNTSARHRVGLSSSLSYKGFSLSATAEYRGGNFAYFDLGYDLVNTGTAAITTVYNRERFVFPNSSLVATRSADGNPATFIPNTSVAVLDGQRGFWDEHYRKYGENFVASAAFWKLREARLSYTIPPALLAEGSKYIKGATISFVGRNLLMFVPKTNQFGDPEFGSSNGNAVGFSDSFNTPTTRTYGINLSVTL